MESVMRYLQNLINTLFERSGTYSVIDKYVENKFIYYYVKKKRGVFKFVYQLNYYIK